MTDDGRALVEALEDAYGHRPSLALYGPSDAGNPSDDAAGESPAGASAARNASAFPPAAVDGLHGSGSLTKLRFRYRAWRADADREGDAAFAEGVPGTRPVVSSVGPPGTDPDAAALAPGWRYLAAADIEWLLERWPELGRFVGAFGAGSLAAGDADPADVPGLDAAVLERRIGSDPGVEPSQRYQARTLKTAAEALRRRGATALAAATLRDRSPGGGTGVLTAADDEKPAYRALADSFEPVQAVLDGPAEPGRVGITFCNDTRDALEATVAWTAGDAAGEATASAGPLEAVDAGAAEIPPDADAVRLTVTAADRTITNRYRL